MLFRFGNFVLVQHIGRLSRERETDIGGDVVYQKDQNDTFGKTNVCVCVCVMTGECTYTTRPHTDTSTTRLCANNGKN